MSKLKLADKFKRLACKLNISSSATEFYYNLIDNSNYGVVYRENLSLIPCRSEDIFELKDNDLITYNRSEQTLFLNPYNDIIYYRLAAERKRRYIKTSYSPLLASVKISGIIFKSENGQGQEIEYTTKANGFKVPVDFRACLTSEPISEICIKNLMQSNPKLLELEMKRRNLTKECKIVLCGCIKFCQDGIIKDTNRHNLCKSLRSTFKLRSFSQSTLNLCMDKLIEAGLISVYFNSIDGTNCFKIVGYKESFDKHEHYVIIPDCVFNGYFKRLQASSVKLFFDILFKLNNGEDDKEHYLGQNKAVYMKFKKLSTDTQKSKRTYEEQMQWLKKRYPGELKTIIFGADNEKDYCALAEYFHFYAPDLKNKKKKPDDENKDTVIQIRIRQEYFVSKKAELFKPLLALKKKDKEKFDLIQNALKGSKIDFTDREVVGLIKVLKNENIKVIKHLLKKLIERISDENQQKIENIAGYMSAIRNNLEPLWD